MPYTHRLVEPVVIRLRYVALVEEELAKARASASTAKYALDVETKTVRFPVQECVLADLLELLRKAKVGMLPEDSVLVQTIGGRGERANFHVTYGKGPIEIK